ncbi:hypothetical protein BKA67DRAFT_533487 [Truncatella angustata]|uniref:Rhodopsin domain-containing protein n=1 Tax=Truncatella angustata TaxID=152316 RepID=A0A9P8UTQ4_9PEZI|nr:uncharacterized protein BKA67DRAFT_533487 [Truncatella angustata]KAH6658332.1 hypothetical protein BKA67DRAFT_533487 [Truncatella angustata]
MEPAPTTVNDNPISGPAVVGVMTTFMILCTVATLGRICTRYMVHQQFWWDDWTMVATWAGTVSMCILQLLMLDHGAGKNVWNVSGPDFKEFSKLFIDFQMVARVSICFAKVSILLLYVRVFFPVGSDRTTLWWIIQVVLLLNLLYTIALILLVALQCVPYGLPWGTTCINQWLLLVISSIVNIISDTAVLVIPWASVWKLQMARKRKWAVWALFAFGTLAPLASLARLCYQIPLASGSNKTVIYTIVAFLAIAEQVVAIIVGCMPVTASWVVRKRRQSMERQDRTLTDRLKPGRESHTSPGQKRSNRRVPDPFALTDATYINSQEQLCSQAPNDGTNGYKGQDLELLQLRTSHQSDSILRIY